MHQGLAVRAWPNAAELIFIIVLLSMKESGGTEELWLDSTLPSGCTDLTAWTVERVSK